MFAFMDLPFCNLIDVFTFRRNNDCYYYKPNKK